MDIAKEQIGKTPDFGVDLDTAFIPGIGKIGEKVVIILDGDKVLTAQEIQMASSISKCPVA